ncbi:hypothetical protein QBC32DRAFT_323044 [Pseudoneurospora amorphoporcata]|uniref:Uncharacterized protein n=1 Tax=Pseudoneurospora amorphoporcata TaxID=241081 RepID=A0AAN6NZR5_9PEZI|nr:hypothetical protein QBC32DRAFT_323044 [Pseudoneurospora amorphoporcata]
MDNPPITTDDSPPPSQQPQESILNRQILPRGLPHSFSSNLNRDVTTPSKKPKANSNRSVRSIIASFESAASKQPPPYSPVFEPITPRCSTVRSNSAVTSFRRVKGSQGRDRGVSECHDARRSRHCEDSGESWGASDAGTGVEGTRSVSTPVIPRASSIMPFALEEEDSLTLLNYKSYFNQPLARCLDGFVNFNQGEEEVEQQHENDKNEDIKLGDKPDYFNKEYKPLRITKRQDRVKTAQTETTHPTTSTSAPRPVRQRVTRPGLEHRKSSASVIALEKLMHELKNFKINTQPLEEQEESALIAMAQDKPTIRRDPKQVQDFWWTVRRNLWVDQDEVYNPEDYSPSTNIAISTDIPKIQLPLPGTTDVSARASCALDKKIPLPAPPIPFRSPNRLSSACRKSPSPVGTPTRFPNRSISTKSNSPLKYSVLTAGHPPPSPSASVRPEPPTPLSPPSFFRQSPSPPPRSSKRPVSPPLSTSGKEECLPDGDTPKASPSNKSDLCLRDQEHAQSRGPSSSSLDVNASTLQADWDSASEYGDNRVREQKAVDHHRRGTQPSGPSLDEIDGLFSRIPIDPADSSPATAVDVGGSQENIPMAESAFEQIKKRIESREEKKRSVHSRHSSLVRLSETSESQSLRSQCGSHHQEETQQEQEHERQHSPHSLKDPPSPAHSRNNDNRRHSRRRLHLSAMNLPGLRHLRSRHSKPSLSSPDSDNLKTPTTANSISSISSTRATISSPVPILSAGISNPGSSIPSGIPYSSIPYSATRSARSSLVSTSDSGNFSQGQKTPTETDKEGAKTGTSGTAVVYHPMQFVTKVPKLKEAPKGRDSEDGDSGKGFRAHFRRGRNKSRDEGPKDDNVVVESSMPLLLLKDPNVEDFLHSHKKNNNNSSSSSSSSSPEKEGLAGSTKIQGEERNGQINRQVGSTEGASSIPLPRGTHRFGRSHSGAGNHHLTSLDNDSHLPHQGPHDKTPTGQIPTTTNSMMGNNINTSYSYSLTLPATRPGARPRPRPPPRHKDHRYLSKIQKLLNSEDSSFNNSLRSFRSLDSGTHYSQSMRSIPESNSTGSMYSQDQDQEDGGAEGGQDEQGKREDASMLIGEVLETVRSLGEDLVAKRRAQP